MNEELHLVRLVLDRRELARIATRHRLRPDIDEGYFVHAGLAQLFATSDEPATVPLCSFAVDDVYAASQGQADLLYVLGYAHEPDASLVGRMGAARGAILRLCKSREMPTFHAGQLLGFRTRVCPVVRAKAPGVGDAPRGLDRHGRTRSRELDAFVHATLGLPRETRVDREEVYVRWLGKQLDAGGACSLGEVRLAEFRREVMRRKGGSIAGGQEPGGCPIERPNAVLEGTLTVGDPAAFRALVARGLGRHRAFGFGMLLLRPAGT